MKEQVGGGQLPELRDSIVSLLVFHSGILSLSFSLLAFSFSLFQLRYSSFLHSFCRTTHTIQNDDEITFFCQFFCTFGMAFVFIRHQQYGFCFNQRRIDEVTDKAMQLSDLDPITK